MRRSILTVAALLLSLTLTACANVKPPPSPTPGPSPAAPVTLKMGSHEVDFAVEVNEETKVARLVIPASDLATNQRNSRVGPNTGAMGNIMAGMALTCAMVSGGFWLARKGRGRSLIPLLVIACLLTAGVSLVWADIPAPWPWSPRHQRPPFRYENPPLPARPVPITLPASVEVSGKLVLEVVDFDDQVKLIVAKEMVKTGSNAPKIQEGK